MTTQLLLNSNNYDSDTGRFVVEFPVEQQFRNTQIAATNINIFNSFYNISAALGNNIMTLWFPSGATHISISITIPDGFYTLKTFNTLWTTVCNTNFLYTLKPDGITKQYYYFLGTNSSYQNLILYYEVPIGAVPPTGASWVSPTVGSQTMYLNWSKGLAQLYGYTSLQIGNGSTVGSYVSETVSKLNTVSSLILQCNMIDNKGISIPSNILTSLPVAGISFGGLLQKTFPKRE
jgi:hypothetical protein